ncbi:hypothetical protein [Patulibacter sp. SYSU D01012]|uniref:hypothetical protein n=1 Tax=Patulibacter sp. SYSU D01012 TaxID=2817381 RepID=UPI001B30F20B|nr:hypothetical protein [Patulibacter sp. SYSU D01012]
MTSVVSFISPHLGDSATPVSMFPVLCRGGMIPASLGVSGDQAFAVGEDVLSAPIDVPPGEWLIWTAADHVMWVGGRVDALPGPVRRRLEGCDTYAIVDLINALADVGVWLREAALLIGGSWGPSRRADAAVREIAKGIVSALSGVFVDRHGRSARLDVTVGAVCWTDRPALTVEWLLTTVDLTAP